MEDRNYDYNYDGNTPQVDGHASQYNDKPDDPKGTPELIVKETVIQQVPRTIHQIEDWRNAHSIADSRYYPNRTWLYDLYDDCRIDGHLSGVLQKRIDFVMNKELYFANAKGERVTEIDKLIKSSEFRSKVIQPIIETLFWGITGLEFIPGSEFNVRIIPRKHIKTKWQVISVQQNGNTGIDYTKAPNIVVFGEPEDLGLLLKVVPYIIYKRNATGAWSQYIDIFGQPIRIMYYDAYDQQAKIELKQTLDESGGSMALMIPKGVEFDIKDGKVTNGDGSLQESFINYLNQEVSIIVVGNVETTTSGKTGSLAKAKVHSQQQEEIVKSDMAYVLSMLNSPKMLAVLESYGYPVAGGAFMFNQDVNIEQQAEQVDIDVKLYTQLGLPLDHDELYKYYGRTKPKDYDQQIAAMQEAKADPNEQQEIDETEQAEQEETGETKPKPAPKKKAPAKPAPKQLSHSRLRNLVDALTDFFGPARR